MAATTHSSQYREYMHSDAWQRRRRRALVRAGYTCQHCGADRNLEVHHLTYARLGKERPADLLVLCHACHAAEHARTKPRRDPLTAIVKRIARHLSRKRRTRRR